ncbi:MAG TPA: GIY-YIG nuclease family protein, partial [Cyclobacteriaceae bacterium]|nr:GIY-YIG nuclease family protein [Cyclobacteriaceae bacterium]
IWASVNRVRFIVNSLKLDPLSNSKLSYFRGSLQDFILNFDELKEIVTNGYGDWKRMLSGAKGIYLISDTKTGKLYVGSAYGEDGIWGRWNSYVSTNGHGGNKQLKELIAKKADYAKNFQFSVLMILPKTITADQAIEKERLFKNKLGTNSFGLNSN